MSFDYDRFLVDQLIRPVANLYRITPLAIGETPAGSPVAYVRQKKLAIKEDIRFYADEGQTQELFRLKARSMLDFGGSRYDVLEGDQRIGVLSHKFKESLLRSGAGSSTSSRMSGATSRSRTTSRSFETATWSVTSSGSSRSATSTSSTSPATETVRSTGGSRSRSPSGLTRSRTASGQGERLAQGGAPEDAGRLGRRLSQVWCRAALLRGVGGGAAVHLLAVRGADALALPVVQRAVHFRVHRGVRGLRRRSPTT